MKKIVVFLTIILFSVSVLTAQDSDKKDSTTKKETTEKKDVKKDEKTVDKKEDKKSEKKKDEKKKVEKKKKTLKEYMADLSAGKDEKTIIEACDFVGKEEEKDAIPKLVSLLGDKRENVRLHSVMALGYIGDEKAVDAINKIMLNDESSDVRYAALLSSVRIGSKKSLDAWKALKAKDSDPFIQDFLKKMEEKARGK